MSKMVSWKRLALAGLMLQAMALNQALPDITVSQNQTYGPYLSDSAGRSVYIFMKDSKDTVTCYDQCAQNWPPLLLVGKAKPLLGQGVDEKLIGLSKRTDSNALQITYGGWPLYYFAKDQKPSDFAGQGVGGNWFLVSPKGEAIKPTAQPAQTTQPGTPAQALAGLKAEGEPIYVRVCVSCHGSQGEGGVGARLASNPRLEQAKYVVEALTKGIGYMPAVGASFSNKELASVITYVRNSFGNNFGPVTEDEVAKLR